MIGLCAHFEIKRYRDLNSAISDLPVSLCLGIFLMEVAEPKYNLDWFEL